MLATSAIALAAFAGRAAAQESQRPNGPSLVASVGIAWAQDDFTLMAGSGWQASLRGEMPLAGPLAGYLGARYANFSLKSAEATDDLSMIAPEAGLVVRPRPWSGLTPFVRAGAFLPQFSSAGEHSGAGVGFSGGVGLEFEVGDRVLVSAVGDGNFSGEGLKAGPFGPLPPKPGWLGAELELRYRLR